MNLPAAALSLPHRGVIVPVWQERMQQVRTERAVAASPSKATSALSSGRASRGRRMSQAGGLTAAGDPRVSLHYYSSCSAQHHRGACSSQSRTSHSQLCVRSCLEAVSVGQAVDTRLVPAANEMGMGLQVAVWEPPASPFGLIEEQLYPDPWKLLLACLLLNKTTAQAVRKVGPSGFYRLLPL